MNMLYIIARLQSLNGIFYRDGIAMGMAELEDIIATIKNESDEWDQLQKRLRAEQDDIKNQKEKGE